MEARFDSSCDSCKAIQEIISLTNAPRILETPHWIIEHVHPTSVRGWLVIVLNRHCSALHQLNAEEFLALGQLLPLVCQALHDTLNTKKEYVVQFAEGEPFDHVHFHVIARLPDWPASLEGPRVFSGLGNNVNSPLSSEITTPVALRIREYLLARIGLS
jgi:diadenosine tetraphosphate (Ap4A) HIT family hydrolase